MVEGKQGKRPIEDSDPFEVPAIPTQQRSLASLGDIICDESFDFAYRDLQLANPYSTKPTRQGVMTREESLTGT